MSPKMVSVGPSTEVSPDVQLESQSLLPSPAKPPHWIVFVFLVLAWLCGTASTLFTVFYVWLPDILSSENLWTEWVGYIRLAGGGLMFIFGIVLLIGLVLYTSGKIILMIGTIGFLLGGVACGVATVFDGLLYVPDKLLCPDSETFDCNDIWYIILGAAEAGSFIFAVITSIISFVALSKRGTSTTEDSEPTSSDTPLEPVKDEATIKIENEAAIVIQRHARGMFDRKKVEEKKQEMAEEDVRQEMLRRNAQETLQNVKPALGISLKNVLDEEGNIQGVLVLNVDEGGPSDNSGLKKGDSILSTEVCGKVVDKAYLSCWFHNACIGFTDAFTVRRDDEELVVNVTVGAEEMLSSVVRHLREDAGEEYCTWEDNQAKSRIEQSLVQLKESRELEKQEAAEKKKEEEEKKKKNEEEKSKKGMKKSISRQKSDKSIRRQKSKGKLVKSKSKGQIKRDKSNA